MVCAHPFLVGCRSTAQGSRGNGPLVNPRAAAKKSFTIAAALVSALTRLPIKADRAMTGEIALRGRVLAVGGVRKKLLAAHRGNVTTEYRDGQLHVPDQRPADVPAEQLTQ
jgi:hypothetical protein